MPMEYLFLIILLVFMIGMMFFQTRKAKQQQEERKNFWSNLAPGTEIVTIGGLIGKVVEVDEQYEEIVIDSEGTLLRFTFRAISREYVRPAYVSYIRLDAVGYGAKEAGTSCFMTPKTFKLISRLREEVQT